jgi:hypothetical protein
MQYIGGSGRTSIGMGQNQDPGSGSGMNIPDHISESLETIFWVKNKLTDPIRDRFDPRFGIRNVKNSDPGWTDPRNTAVRYVIFATIFVSTLVQNKVNL